MSDKALSENEMIEMAVAGDPEGYRSLLKTYNTFAYSIAYKITKNREDSEEVVQDSFLKAFRAIKGFKREGKFSTWLYSIVYHTSLTRIRNKKIAFNSIEESFGDDSDFEISANYSDVFEKLVRDDQAKLLNQAIETLTVQENLAVTLYYLCQNSVSEIESITGWKSSTIKIRLFRARQKLYTELSRLLKDNVSELL